MDSRAHAPGTETLPERRPGTTGGAAEAIRRAVATWLRDAGYTIQESHGDPADVVADGPPRMLVQVKAGDLLDEPADHASPDLDRIRARAIAAGAQAWRATVRLDPRQNPIGSIGWVRLI